MSVINGEGVTNRTSAAPRSPAPQQVNAETVVFLDMDAVLLDAHQGRRGIELNVQGDVDDGLGRLAQIADVIVVLAYPQHVDGVRRPSTESRINTLRDGLNGTFSSVEIVACPHGGYDEPCNCSKPGSGLIEIARRDYSLPVDGGWFIGADQEGVQSGRHAGLRTVRVGPVGSDHMSNVHRPDYEARDLLDAANHILIEDLN
jgi:histidinol phosphatase-like enzyme